MTQTDYRNEQLKLYLRQSYSNFNVYGRTKEAMYDQLAAFTASLAEYSHEDVSKAFGDWLRTKSVMPTPADIRALASEYSFYRLERVRMATAPKQIAAPATEETPAVKWAMMDYAEVSKRGWLQDVRDHFLDMATDKQADYLKYLTGMCRFPVNFLRQKEEA